jgi:hypothetical protein
MCFTTILHAVTAALGVGTKTSLIKDLTVDSDHLTVEPDRPTVTSMVVVLEILGGVMTTAETPLEAKVAGLLVRWCQ